MVNASSVFLILTICLLGTAGCNMQSQELKHLVRIIGSQGHEPGKFNRPRGICYDDRDNILYVVDWDGRLQAFSEDGTLLRSWMMPEVAKGKPETLFLTPEHTILVTDTHYSRVVEFSNTGKVLRMFGDYGREAGQFIYPVGICMDAEGYIYVSEYGENDRIQKFTREGVFVSEWGQFGNDPGEFQRPSGMKIGSDGLLYVADAVNHRVQVFTTDGELQRVIGQQGRELGDFIYPYDVAIRDQSLFVLEYGGQRLQKFTLEGKVLMAYGGGGREKGSFFAPWRLTATTEHLYVSDTNNNRVVQLDL